MIDHLTIVHRVALAGGWLSLPTFAAICSSPAGETELLQILILEVSVPFNAAFSSIKTNG